MFFSCFGVFLALVVGTNTKGATKRNDRLIDDSSQIYSVNSNEYGSYEDDSSELNKSLDNSENPLRVVKHIVSTGSSKWIPINASDLVAIHSEPEYTIARYNEHEQEKHNKYQRPREHSSRGYEVTENPPSLPQTEHGELELAIKHIVNIPEVSAPWQGEGSSETNPTYSVFKPLSNEDNRYSIIQINSAPSTKQNTPVEDQPEVNLDGLRYSAHYDTITPILHEQPKNLAKFILGNSQYPANSHRTAIVLTQLPPNSDVRHQNILQPLKGQFNGILSSSVPTVRYGTPLANLKVPPNPVIHIISPSVLTNRYQNTVPVASLTNHQPHSLSNDNLYISLRSNENSKGLSLGVKDTNSVYTNPHKPQPNLKFTSYSEASSTDERNNFKAFEGLQKALSSIARDVSGIHKNINDTSYSIKFKPTIKHDNSAVQTENIKIKDVKPTATPIKYTSQIRRPKSHKKNKLPTILRSLQDNPEIATLLSKLSAESSEKHKIPIIIAESTKGKSDSILPYEYPPSLYELLDKPPSLEGFHLKPPSNHELPVIEEQEVSREPVGYSLSLIVKSE